MPHSATDQEAGIRVYYNAYFEASYQRRNLGKIHRLFAADRIELADILACPERYVLLFRTSMVEHDFGGTMPRERPLPVLLLERLPGQARVGGTAGEADGRRRPVRGNHTSGHIFAEDIVSFVRAINPAW